MDLSAAQCIKFQFQETNKKLKMYRVMFKAFFIFI